MFYSIQSFFSFSFGFQRDKKRQLYQMGKETAIKIVVFNADLSIACFYAGFGI